MLKRIFLLVLAVVAGWIAWRWLRGYADEFDNGLPQLAPLEPPAREAFAPPGWPAPTAPEAVAPPDVPATIQSPVGAAEPERAGPGVAASDDADIDPSGTPPGAAPGAPPTVPAPTPIPEAPRPSTPEISSDTAKARSAPRTPTPEPRETSAPQHAPDEHGDGQLEGTIGYCVRCKTKRTIAGAHEEMTESGRRAARGTCPVCGANMFTFLPAEV